MPPIRRMLPLITLLSVSACGATSTPDGLAKALQKALDAGDFTAAGALADIEGAPAEARFAYFDAVYGCAADMQCKVAIAPLDDALRKDLVEDAKTIEATPIAAEGVVVVTETSRDGSGSGELRMPYVKTGGTCRIAVMRPGAPSLAKARARSNADIVTQFFATGIYDPATNARRTDWASAAAALPADGGEPGRAWVASTKAMAAAVDAKDPDAAMRAGGRWAELVFAEKSFDGKPIAKEQRRRKLVAQSQRMLRDVKISGGYRLGDDAALVFEGRNGSGWIERGVVLVSKSGDAWDVAGKETVSYPE